MMMPILGFIFVVIFGAVTSQNHDVNLLAPYKEMTRKRSVEATTLIPPDPHVEDPGMRHLLTRLENLCMERLEYLITDTNSRFLSLENQSSVVHSTVNNIGDKLDRFLSLENQSSVVHSTVNNIGDKLDRIDDRFLSLENQSSVVHSTVNNIGDKLDRIDDRFLSLENQSSVVHSTVNNIGDKLDRIDDRFLSLENQSSVVHSTVNNIGDKLDRIDDRFLSLENQSLVVHSTVNNIGDNLEANNKKMDNLTMEVGRMSQCCSVPAIPVVQNSEILEGKMENLSKTLQELMDVSRNVSSDVQAIKQDDSSLINVTRSLVDLSSNSELKQIFNKGLQELKDLQTSTSTVCPPNITLDKQYPRNCREVQQSGKTASGTYMIQPEHAPKPFEVVCDLETRGGGWTVIQRRFDGSQDFYLGWEDYKNGFGILEGELWLGLENMYLITGFAVNELLIEMGDFESQNRSAFYSEFNLGSELEGYSLKVLGAYSGDAGDSLSSYHLGSKFSTKDKDQEDHSLNLAESYHGAWWYSGSNAASLNGKYYNRDQLPSNYSMLFWITFNGNKGLKHTRMLVRPKV